MENLDDIFYPLYLEYNENKNNFFEKHKKHICSIFNKMSNGGAIRFKWCQAKNGDYCYAVDVIYNNRLIKNRVGYRDKNIALMSIVHALRMHYFE